MTDSQKALERLDKLTAALGHVRTLLTHPNPTQVLSLTGSTDIGPGYQSYLNIARVEAPKSEAIRLATVRWLELGLDAWDVALAEGDQSNFSLWVSSGRAPGMCLDTFRSFIASGYVKQDANRLTDRILSLIARVRTLDVDDDSSFWDEELARWIRRRTGCHHRNDPQRDEMVCKMLLERYGLDPSMVDPPRRS